MPGMRCLICCAAVPLGGYLAKWLCASTMPIAMSSCFIVNSPVLGDGMTEIEREQPVWHYRESEDTLFAGSLFVSERTCVSALLNGHCWIAPDIQDIIKTAKLVLQSLAATAARPRHDDRYGRKHRCSRSLKADMQHSFSAETLRISARLAARHRRLRREPAYVSYLPVRQNRTGRAACFLGGQQIRRALGHTAAVGAS